MIVKLECGSRTLNINDGVNYKTGTTFTPPSAVEDTNYAAGTSANRYGGSKLIGKRARDREWEFDVIVMGTSVEETHSLARDLAGMLSLASSGPDTLYLVYQAHDAINYEPIFGGVGGVIRYPIKYGAMQFNDNYGMGRLRYQRLFCTVTLEVAPYAQGRRQALLAATGGVIDDWIGNPDGTSRGLLVPPATTNKMTNPAFSNATWDTGWTAGAHLVVFENKDMNYVLFGFGSAKITAIGATTRTFTQSIDSDSSATHTLSCYAKLPNGGVISATQITMTFNSSDKTTVYTPMGNGWYRLTATFSSADGAKTYGVSVTEGYTVYVDGFQLEELAYVTPFCYGNLPGCAWTGTAQASSSTRSAGRASVPCSRFPALEHGGTATVILRMNVASTIHDNSVYAVLYEGARGITIEYLASGTKFQFDGYATIVSAAQTFAANALYVLTATWSPAGMAFYVNGALAGTGAHTTLASYIDLYVGSDESFATQSQDTILGLGLYQDVMTAAEVALQYAEISQQINSGTYGRMVGCLPYFWTSNGANLLYNGTDTNTPRNNYAYIGGVTGSAPAITDMQITTGGAPSTYGRLNLSLLPMNYGQLVPYDLMYFEDESGTTLASANGSAVLKTTVNTTAAVIASNGLPRAGVFFMAGMEYYVLSRMYCATSANKTYDITTSFAVGNNTITSDAVRRTLVSTARLYYFGPLVAPSHATMQYEKIGVGSPTMTITANLNANTTVTRSTATVDYMAMMPRPLLMVPTAGFTYSTGQLYISGRDVMLWDGTSYRDTANPTGDAIEFVPGALNLLTQLMGDDTVANLVTWTATYTCFVTPRYSLV